MRHVPFTLRRTALIAARARGHRFSPTLSEARPWRELSGRRLLGVVFRRQVPLAGRWIADFFAPAIGLVVEVDGSIHERTRRADAQRDEKLRRLGYRVLRVDAALVLHRPEAAVALVREAVEKLHLVG